MTEIGADFTRRLLVDAGIGPGMRVLDIGCGSGEVTCLAGELVGREGIVLGVDRDAGPLVAARERALQRDLPNVTVSQGDIDRLPPDLPVFDAVVGRRVLMYQPDAALAVRRLAEALRPGGLIVFQEHDATMAPTSLAPMPLHRQAQDWLTRTIEREGADLHMGFHLHGALTRAGLAVEQVRAEAIVQTPTAPYAIGAIVRAVLPRIIGQGIATDAEIDIETLDARLDEERAAANATYVGGVMFGAWARRPL